ncbi:MAG: hypothetical protein C5B48_04750 [Candidatus Rokuibacteriota bacterium]|nr:MAG: hypothetical protein C5B48_04750 [Candidatus Rokubacteria bacterium]
MTESFPERFRRNTVSNYANAGVALLIAVVMTPVLVHGLGKDAYGIWVLVGSTVLYFDLLKFGLGGAVVKYVAEGDVQRDADLLRRTVTTSVVVLLVPASILIVLAPALALLFPTLFDVPSSLETAAMISVVLACVDLAIAIPADTFGSTLIGLQRYDLLNLTLVVTAVGQAVAWTVVLLLGGGIVALGAVTLVLSVASQAARYALVKRLLPETRIARMYFDRTLVRPFAGLSAWISVIEVSRVVIGRIDTIVVGLVVGVPEAGVYAVGQKLASLPTRFAVPALESFFPHGSVLAASGAGDPSRFAPALKTGTRLAMAIAAPLTIALATLARPTIEAWVGPGFGEATMVVVYLSVAALFTSVTSAGTYILSGAGIVEVPAAIIAGEAVLNFGLSVVLAASIGLVGVALGTLVAAAVMEVVILLPYICRRAGTSFSSLVLVLVRAYLVPTILALGVALLLRGLGVHGLAEVLAAGAAVVGTYVAAMFVTALSRDERARVFAVARSQVSPGSSS